MSDDDEEERVFLESLELPDTEVGVRKPVCPNCDEDTEEPKPGHYECLNCGWEGEIVKISGKESECPYCGSDDLDWGDFSLKSDGENMCAEVTCNDCGSISHKLYDLEFVGSYTAGAENHPKNRE